MNHRFNFMPPPRPMGVQNNGQMQGNHGNNYQQRVWQDSNNYRHRDGTPTMNNSGSQTNGFQQNRDDYAGLMTNREKQWLLNIQMLQLNTGTPYFDDYYYTVSEKHLSIVWLKITTLNSTMKVFVFNRLILCFRFINRGRPIITSKGTRRRGITRIGTVEMDSIGTTRDRIIWCSRAFIRLCSSRIL